MTGNQALFSNVHHLKGNMDDHRRISSEILAMASNFFYRLRLIFTA